LFYEVAFYDSVFSAALYSTLFQDWFYQLERSANACDCHFALYQFQKQQLSF
jgi:hypothetical protein